MQELQAYATAIHEAGHAVVAEAVGFTVVSVTMDRGDGTPYCHYRAPALSLRTWRTWPSSSRARLPRRRSSGRRWTR